MKGLGRDAEHTIRFLRRNRGFAAAVLITIGLGVGGATTMFSVVYGVLLQPLPYSQSGQLVRLWEVHRSAHAPVDVPLLTNLTYQSWARSSANLEALGAFEAGMRTVSDGGGGTQRLRGLRVTPSLFTVLRVAARHGRLTLSVLDSSRDSPRARDSVGAAPLIATSPHLRTHLTARWRRSTGKDVPLGLTETPFSLYGVGPPINRMEDTTMRITLEEIIFGADGGGALLSLA